MKKPTIRKLIKKLDSVYSKFIRKKYADDFGNVKCFTCPKVMRWEDAQCGHYCSRRHMSLRFEPKNTHVQCLGCNVFKHGELDIYALNLQAKYGDGILKELNALKNTTKQWTIGELQELIQKYQ